MSTDVNAFARNLRRLADEIESADRFGIPVPPYWSMSGHHAYGGATFHATPAEFTAWLEYANADAEQPVEVEEYELDGNAWRRVVRADINGLAISFATSKPIAVEVSA